MRTRLVFGLGLVLAIGSAAPASEWQAIGPFVGGPDGSLPAEDVLAVAVDPMRPARIYAATARGLFVSRDAGETWKLSVRGLRQDLPQCQVGAIAFDPRRRSRMYLGTGPRVRDRRGCGVYQGSRSGRRWRLLGLDEESVSAIAAHPTDRRILVLGTASDGSDFFGSILRFRRGRPRVVEGGRPSRFETLFWGALTGDRDVDFLDVAFDPRSPSTVYVATNHKGIAKTTDNGATWTRLTLGSGLELIQFPYTFVLDPRQPDTLYVGATGPATCCPFAATDGDLYASRDGGLTWTPSTSGLANQNVLAIALDAQAADRLYIGTTDGVFRSDDGGRTLTPVGTGLSSRIVPALATTPDGDALYAGTRTGGVFKLSLP